MFCEWKNTVDAGDFIVIVLDKCMIDNADIEMQAVYASKSGKKVFALIENGGKPAAYMLELRGFMWEPFDPDSQESFNRAMTKLMARYEELKQAKFICFMVPNAAWLFEMASGEKAKQAGAASSAGGG